MRPHFRNGAASQIDKRVDTNQWQLINNRMQLRKEYLAATRDDKHLNEHAKYKGLT